MSRVACHVHGTAALVSKDASRLSAPSQSVRNRSENRPIAKRETKVFGETAAQYVMATPCQARAANSAYPLCIECKTRHIGEMLWANSLVLFAVCCPSSERQWAQAIKL